MPEIENLVAYIGQQEARCESIDVRVGESIIYASLFLIFEDCCKVSNDVNFV